MTKYAVVYGFQLYGYYDSYEEARDVVNWFLDHVISKDILIEPCRGW